MESLSIQSDAVFQKLGLPSHAPGAAFKTAEAVLQIPIGGPEKIYLSDHREPNGAYIENGVQRAMEILKMLNVHLLRIDCDPAELSRNLSRLHLGMPEQTATHGTESSCYWQLPKDPEALRPLFREIIRSELSPAGLEWLCGQVYLIGAQPPLLFYPEDDREACLLCSDSRILSSVARYCRDFPSD